MKKHEQYWDGEPGAWTLAESDKYILKAEYESVDLIIKPDMRKIGIGDFYGEPTAGIIDKNEKFCIMVGCGGIVYKLAEPYLEYEYHGKTSQWYEFGRGPKMIEWIEKVKQITDNEVEITDENGNTRIITIDEKFT